MAGDATITITRPYRVSLADVPGQVIVASLPEMAVPLIANTYAKAQLMARLRRGAKRLRFVEAKITLNGYRLTIVPKGPLVHLLDTGTRAHTIIAKNLRKETILTQGDKILTVMKGMLPVPTGGGAVSGDSSVVYRKSVQVGGITGKHFMPAALTASQTEMQRILDRNTATYLERAEAT